METLQIVGYVASVIIAISMVMNSLLKLRIINFFGAITFAIYGFLISAYPVGALNTFIALIDVYYLSKMLLKKEYFKGLYVRANNYYLINFLDFKQYAKALWHGESDFVILAFLFDLVGEAHQGYAGCNG